MQAYLWTVCDARIDPTAQIHQPIYYTEKLKFLGNLLKVASSRCMESSIYNIALRIPLDMKKEGVFDKQK